MYDMIPSRAILFCGGGTMGSVTPLLALREEFLMQHPDTATAWAGTRQGIERDAVVRYGIPYLSLLSGKFRRYWSWKNITDPFLVFLGFLQSLAVLIMVRPRAVVSAGGFVAVPLHLAAFLLRIPSLGIQLDVPMSITNRILAPILTHLAVIGDAATPVAVPVRASIRAGVRDKAACRTHFGFTGTLPVVLVMGGGSGAAFLNHALFSVRKELYGECYILHQTGAADRDHAQREQEYVRTPFFADDITQAYAAADIVVSRAGMGTICECAYLKLPMILVPLPGSAQEQNARYLESRDAAIVILQDTTAVSHLTDACRMLIRYADRRLQLGSSLAAAIRTDTGASLTRILAHLLSI